MYPTLRMARDHTWYTAAVPQAFVRITPELLDASRRGAIVTPNERLAREVTEALAWAEAERGSQAWVPPVVASWGQYLKRQLPHGVAEVVSADGLKLLLRKTAPPRLRGLLNDAAQAWHLTRQYPIGDLHPAIDTWFSTLERTLADRQLVAESQLEAALIAVPPSSSELTLLGFEHLTHQQKALLDAWRETGCTVRTVAPEESSDGAFRTSFPNPEAELAAAARWARQVLESDPGARVGVLVPDIPARYHPIVRQFGAVLDPAVGSRSATFDIASGPPLEASSIWAVAARYLTGFHTSLRARDLQAVIGSRHLAFSGQPDRLPWLAGWAALVERWPEPVLRRLHERFQAMTRGDVDARLPLQRWLRFDLEALHQQRWAQAQAGSNLFQTRRAIVRALERCSLEAGSEQLVSHEEAVQLYTALLAETTFAPQRARAPVQILGYLESTGLSFSHLWVCGLSDRTLPAAPRQNPLLPSRQMEAAGVPRSTHDTELAFAESRLRQWQAAAGSVVLSYAEAPDEPVAPSPLIVNLPPCPPGFLIDDTPVARQAATIPVPEGWNVAPLPPGVLPGGSGLLQAQSDCPFQAFARYRLKLSEPQRAESFANPLHIGNVVHKALEALLSDHRTIGDIEQISSAEVRDAVIGAAEDLLEEWPEAYAHRFVEQICGRLESWLRYEQSAAFANVLSLEEERRVDLGGYQVRAVIDRLDVADGRSVVVDYKTGNRISNQGMLGDEDITKVQLPLYALAEPDIGALLYAWVQEPPAYSGLQDAAMPKIPQARAVEDWPQQLADWRRGLTTLAQAFANGPALPAPAKDSTCRDCPVSALCRNSRDGLAHV